MSKKIVSVFLFLAILLASSGTYVWANKQKTSSTCAPFNVSFEKEDSNLKVTWKTQKKCSGLLKYGNDINNLNYTLVEDAGLNYTDSHIVTIKNTSDKTYLLIISDNVAYGLAGLPLTAN